ncbi:MAG TPA: hypothetical protein VLG38_05170 [Gammaproteobacteria bacterium]|nr:hypothetical protein [Gammaproteobacteria bacterium]
MIKELPKQVPSQESLLLTVTGRDACKFLQGQLTCDVATLADGHETLGAYCNIKGKVDSLFTLRRAAEDYHLSMHQDLLQPTLQELKKYAVFSKVKLDIMDSTTPAIDEKQQILNKIPAIYSQTINTFFPHDINLPALGAVSFTKGCYRGQEIVARMEHRGNIKRSMYVFTSKHGVQPGDTVTTNDARDAGTVVRACWAHDMSLGLAVIASAHLQQTLFIRNTECSIEIPCEF